MNAHYYLNLGRYNYAGTDKEWCLALYTSHGNVSEHWPEDEEPEVGGLLPSEVLDLIESRLDSYLWKSSRERTKQKIASIREHANEIDVDWLDGKIKAAELRLVKLRERREALAGVAS